MTKTFKIFISKKENSKKIISLDEPLVLNHCHKMFLKSATIFWDYNNLDESYFYNYDVDGNNTKVTFKEGYYTFSSLKKEFENTGKIELEEEFETGKCKLKTDKKMNLKTTSPILGFSSNKEIAANTLTTSDTVVNINNGLEFVNIHCNPVNKSRNFLNGKRSNVLCQIPIPSNQTLKGSVSSYIPSEEKEGVMLSNGIFNELEFKVEVNNSSSIGNVLLEFSIK